MTEILVKNPSILQFPSFINNTSVYIAEQIEQHGDIIQFDLPGYEIWGIANIDFLQHVMLRNESNYIKSRFYWHQLRHIIGDALGTLEGDAWENLKRIHTKALTRTKTESYLPTVHNIIVEFISTWKQSTDTIHDSIELFSELNVAILLQTLFGYDNKNSCREIASMIAYGQQHLLWRSKYPWRPLLAKITGRDKAHDQSLEFFNQLAEDVVENRSSTTNDIERLIDLLIIRSFEMESDAFRRELRSELIVYLGAGTETTAVGLGWTLYLLALHPDKLMILRNEIDEVTHGVPINLEHLDRLTYTDCVIKEGLRLYSPSHALVRDAIEEDIYQGIKISKNASLFVSTYAIHRNQAYWPNPNDFIPERFETEPSKYTYIPFGVGRHNCIGRYLATPMMILTLASFVQQFDFILTDHRIRTPQSGSTLKPDIPFLITLKNRL